MRVEHQIAIIYCGTKGLLQRVPVNRVKDFQDQFIHHLEEYHKEAMQILKSGQLTDEVVAILDKEARELAQKYEK